MSQAQQLLEKLQGKTKTTISILDMEFTFHLDNAAYEAMINDMDNSNKITPIRDYLLATIDPAQKDDFALLLQVPQFALKVGELVNKEFSPKIEATIKN